jgi:hypothetical protein
MVTVSMLLLTGNGYSQEAVEKIDFKINDITVSLRKYLNVKTDQGVCEVSGDVKLTRGGKKIYQEQICSAELPDVKIVTKGYLTVVEHYSSPVGWSQFYVFDLCKMRLLLTKKLQESPGLPWEKFIDVSDDFKAKYIEKIVQFYNEC